jgi:hypothetical protein
MPNVSIIPNFSSFPLYLVATGLRTIQFLFSLEAVAEGLGRHIWPPLPPTHFTEFLEKSNDTWHELTWIDMNDMN